MKNQFIESKAPPNSDEESIDFLASPADSDDELLHKNWTKPQFNVEEPVCSPSNPSASNSSAGTLLPASSTVVNVSSSGSGPLDNPSDPSALHASATSTKRHMTKSRFWTYEEVDSDADSNTNVGKGPEITQDADKPSATGRRYSKRIRMANRKKSEARK
ncbi:hypothetical protein D9757_012153 [Collybiopsis confluens]|uniref:Uncharacterized protein n=1 Tax=Collybiopsis confluens TaxID=2823264 RepID=A0A8H5LJT9_9AGAR|nr:hypothetical protein D9757_012153 [Collybiopsis confluens]